MKLSGMGVFLTMLYDDRFDIYRTDKKANDDSSIDIFYQDTPKYVDVPGRLSFSSDDTGSESTLRSCLITRGSAGLVFYPSGNFYPSR